jgi:cellulose synthase/poly-beta-1,6-N-acetylglucosamine synthase-like glycosyltransferase
MIASYEVGDGMVTGITKVQADDWFGKMQACDWWLNLAVVKVMTDRGINLTAMGNNLLVERSAYHQVGGFAAVANSVTEDLALCRKVAAAGYHPASRVNARLLVTTKAEPSYPALLRQRKRWARGALTLPVLWKLLLFLQVAFYPAILCVMVYCPWIGTASWTVKILIQSKIISLFSALTETKIRRLHLFSFECYQAVVGCSTALYYFWPSAIRWKDREYGG